MIKLLSIFRCLNNNQNQFFNILSVTQKSIHFFVILTIFILSANAKSQSQAEDVGVLNRFVCIDGRPLFYPSPENSPQVQLGKPATKQAVKKSGCEVLALKDFQFNVSLLASFNYEGDVSSLIERFGGISKLQGIRYWSVKDGKWETLIVKANALEGRSKRKRPDFSSRELTSGSEVYFSQQDNRSSGSVIYLMKIEKYNERTLIINVINIEPIRFLFVPIFQPGDVRATYVLEKISPHQWGYFNFISNKRVSDGSPEAQEKSSINRAVAFYRHFIGIPTDVNPPFAP